MRRSRRGNHTAESSQSSLSENSAAATDRATNASPASTSNGPGRRGTVTKILCVVCKWEARRLHRLCTGAQYFLRRTCCFHLLCEESVFKSLYRIGAESLANLVRKTFGTTRSRDWGTYSRLLRLAVLLLGSLAGFSYAASSGQLPLLLPARRPANYRSRPPTSSRPLPSYPHSASVHTRGELGAAGVTADDEGPRFHYCEDGAGGRADYSHPAPAQQEEARQLERELLGQMSHESKSQLQDMPPSLPKYEQPEAEHGCRADAEKPTGQGRGHRQSLIMPQHSRRWARWTPPVLSGGAENIHGIVDDFTSEGDEEDSAQSAATSMWLLLLLFSFIPSVETWPRRDKEGRPRGDTARHEPRSHSGVLTGPPPAASITAAVSQRCSTLDPQHPRTLLDNQRGFLQECVSQRGEQDGQQHTNWWCRGKGLKNTVFWRSIVERREPVEVSLQCAELVVVGFFLTFFLAKALFACDSILRQMEGHFAVLLLAQHLQEYLFCFWSHAETLSVDRFIFNNGPLYTVAVAVSLLEMHLKAYELAVGTTLGQAVRGGGLPLHIVRRQNYSSTLSAIARTHRREVSKQQHWLHSVRVNMLMLELSWVAHLVRTAVKMSESRGTHPAYSTKIRDRSESSERNSICRAPLRTREERDVCTAGGVHGSAVARTASYLYSETRAGVAVPLIVKVRTRRSESCCGCSLSAVCEYWHSRWFEDVRDDTAVVYGPADGENGSPHRSEHSRDFSFFSPSSSSTYTENNNGGSLQGETSSSVQDDGLGATDFASQRSWPGDNGEKIRVRSCWELYLLLCCGILGGVCAVGGLVLRGLAQLTARKNFTHKIACAKAEEHVLVAHGVYALLRHPGYAGSFYWAIGVQMMVCNPGTLLLTFYVMRIFFFHRVAFEERMLEQIFPDGVYAAYRAATPSIGIPFLARRVRQTQEKVEATTTAPREESGAQRHRQTF